MADIPSVTSSLRRAEDPANLLCWSAIAPTSPALTSGRARCRPLGGTRCFRGSVCRWFVPRVRGEDVSHSAQHEQDEGDDENGSEYAADVHVDLR